MSTTTRFATALLAAAMLLAAPIAAAQACGDYGAMFRFIALDAVSDDSETADNAIRSLRGHGERGLEAMFEAHAEAIEAAHRTLDETGELPATTEWIRLSTAIDAVAGVRDAHLIGLFWHTDMEQARHEAAVTGKPILSLRLLGNLDDEYSCANSRFFRTLLYANTGIASTLRESFVLHWRSVRPVPVITIDLGDGRRIVRTITGNSCHYLLDAEGRVLDAMPGLVAPAHFSRWLTQGRITHDSLRGVEGEARAERLHAWHAAQVTRIDNALRGRLGAIDVAVADDADPRAVLIARAPEAIEAARMAVSKSGIERPMLDAMARERLLRSIGENEAAIESTAVSLPLAADSALWGRLGAAALDEVQIDAGTRRMMIVKTCGSDVDIDAMIARFRADVATDTVLNLYSLKRRIHERLATELPDVEALNAWVYDEVFLTPDSDPWLGLAPEDVFTALPDNGLED